MSSALVDFSDLGAVPVGQPDDFSDLGAKAVEQPKASPNPNIDMSTVAGATPGTPSPAQVAKQPTGDRPVLGLTRYQAVTHQADFPRSSDEEERQKEGFSAAMGGPIPVDPEAAAKDPDTARLVEGMNAQKEAHPIESYLRQQDPILASLPVGAYETGAGLKEVATAPFRGVKTSDTMAVQNPKGLAEPGNLPIWDRPGVQNSDGTHSSEYSTSFEDENGREVLVPTVVNGKFLTPDGKKPEEGSPEEKAMFRAAWQHYLKTGENLGKFDSADDADAYSETLHNRGARPASSWDLAARGGTRALSGAMEAGTIPMGTGVAQAPLRMGIGYLEAIAAGKSAEYAAKKMGLSPDEQEFANSVATFLPMAYHTIKANTTLINERDLSQHVPGAPEGTTAKGVQVGPAGAMVTETPAGQKVLRTKVGPFTKNVTLSEGRQLPPAPVDPAAQVAREQAQTAASAMADHDALDQAAKNMANGVQPPQPGEEGSGKAPLPAGMERGQVTPQTVQNVGKAIAMAPPEARGQMIQEAHQNLAAWMAQQGKVQGPDGQITVLKNPEQAQQLAAKWINDEVGQQQKAQEDAQKAQEGAAKAAEKAANDTQKAQAKAQKEAQKQSDQQQKEREKAGEPTVEQRAKTLLDTYPERNPVAVLQRNLGLNFSDAQGLADRVRQNAPIEAAPKVGGEGHEVIEEARATVDKQVEALQAGTIKAVHIPEGSTYTPKIPDGMKAVDIKNGPGAGRFIYDPQQIRAATIKEAARAGTHGDLLGHVSTKQQVAQSENPVIVQARDQDGTVIQDSAVDGGNAGAVQAQTESLQERHPGAHISVVQPHEALNERIEANSADGFTTSKGSRYQLHVDGTTTRNKAYRPEHGEAEQGIQPRSERTFYVSAEDANKLGEFQARGGPRKAISTDAKGQAAVMYLDGKDAGKFEQRTLVATHSRPAPGLTPVELWDGGTRVHFGNEITEVHSGEGGKEDFSDLGAVPVEEQKSVTENQSHPATEVKPAEPAKPAAGEAAGSGPATPEVAKGEINPEAEQDPWRIREEKIKQAVKASKAAGNPHVDQLYYGVETMRGVHFRSLRDGTGGTITTVGSDNLVRYQQDDGKDDIVGRRETEEWVVDGRRNVKLNQKTREYQVTGPIPKAPHGVTGFPLPTAHTEEETPAKGADITKGARVTFTDRSGKERTGTVAHTDGRIVRVKADDDRKSYSVATAKVKPFTEPEKSLSEQGVDATMEASRKQGDQRPETEQRTNAEKDVANNQGQKDAAVGYLREHHPQMVDELLAQNPDVRAVLERVIEKEASKESSGNANPEGHSGTPGANAAAESSGSGVGTQVPQETGRGETEASASESALHGASPGERAESGIEHQPAERNAVRRVRPKKAAKVDQPTPEQTAIEQHRAAHVPGEFARLVTEHGKWADKLVELLKDPKADPKELAEIAAKVDELAPQMEQETGNRGGPVYAADFGYEARAPEAQGEPAKESDLSTDRGAEEPQYLSGGLGAVIPSGALAKAAKPVLEFLGVPEEYAKVRASRDLQDGLYTLESRANADVLRAKDLMKDAPGTATDSAIVYHHIEDPTVPLNAVQRELLDEYVSPLMRATEAKVKLMREDGATIENYVHRIVKGKGNFIDRLLAGSKSTGKGNVLRKTVPSEKSRTMMALQPDAGSRTVVSIKGDRVTAFRSNGTKEDLGPLSSGLTTRLEQLDQRLEPVVRDILKARQDIKDAEQRDREDYTAKLQDDVDQMKRDRDLIGTIKGRVPGQQSAHGVEVSFRKRASLTEKIDKAERELEAYKEGRAEIRLSTRASERIRRLKETISTLEAQRNRLLEQVPTERMADKVWLDKNGKRWKITQATTKEIENVTDLEYYHNALGSAVINWLAVEKQFRALQFLKAFTESPDFARVGMKMEDGKPAPEGWKTTELPQLRGYHFEPHIAEVLDWYNDRLKSREPGIFEKINDFLVSSIFFNPLLHVPNILNHWAVEKGVSGWVDPTIKISQAKAIMKAINAVIHQNDDFLAALDAGAPLQSQRFGTHEYAKIFLEKMQEQMEATPTAWERTAKLLGYANPLKLLDALKTVSGRVTWYSNDIAFLQAAYEKTANGMDLKTALRETAKHIPDYRMPTRIFDSAALQKVLSNRNLVMFMHYHYGALKSYGETLKSLGNIGWTPDHEDAKGEDANQAGRTKDQEKLHGMDILAMLGLVTLVVYPAIDALLRKMTGNKDATIRRAGASTLPYNLIQMAHGEKSPSDVLQSVITPGVTAKALTELATNRDLRTGREIYNYPVHDWETFAQQAGGRLAHSFGPANEYLKASRQGFEKQALGMVGISFPQHGAMKIASEIATSKADRHALTPADAKRIRARYQALDALRAGDDVAAQKLMQEAGLTHRQRVNLKKEVRENPLVAKVHNFTGEELQQVYDHATAEEKTQLGPLLRHKQREERKHSSASR